MADNETRVVYRAIADFAAVSREARQARREIRELRAEEARLNAQSAAGSTSAASAADRHTSSVNNSTRASRASTGATNANSQSIRDNAAALISSAAAHRNHEGVARRAATVAGGMASSFDRAGESAGRLSRKVAELSPNLDRSNSSTSRLGRTLQTVVGPMQRVNNMFDRLGKWRPSLVPPFIALIPAIAGVLSLLNPLVAGLGAVGGAAIGFASSLGRVSGAALAAIPGLFTLLSTVLALKSAFSGIGTAFSAFKAAKTARGVGGGGGGGSTAGTGVKLAELTLQEKLTRAQEAYRRSVEDVKFAQDDLNDARKDYIRRLNDLKRAVEGAGLSEMRAAADVQLALEEYKRTLADPNASQGDRMAAEVAYKEALEAQGAVQEENKKNAEDLVEMKKKGMDGDEAVIRAQRGLTDAINRVRDAQLELTNVRRRDAQEAAAAARGGAGGAGAWDAYNAALRDLSPSARSVVKQLVAMYDAWKAVKRIVQEAFFAPVVDDIWRLRRALPAVQSLLVNTAHALGLVTENFIKLVTSPGWQSDLMLLGAGNASIIENVGAGILDLLDGFKDLAVIVQPFLTELTRGFANGAKNLRLLVAEAREGGSLGKWLLGDETSRGVLDTLRQWWRIIKNIGSTIGNYAGAAKEFSEWLTDAFENSTKGWLRTSEEATKEGSPFQKWLEDIKPVLSELSRLFDTFFSWFVRESADTSNINQMVEILKVITDKLGPALTALFDNLSKAEIGPKFFETLSKLVEIIGTLANSGAVETFFDVLNSLLDAVIAFLDLPGAPEFIGALASAFAALAAVSFVMKFSGLENLIGWLLKLATGGSGLPTLLRKIAERFGLIAEVPSASAARAVSSPVARRAVGGPRRYMPGAAPLGQTPMRAAPTFWQRLTGQLPKAASAAGSAAKSTTALSKAGQLVSKAGGFLAKGAKLATGPIGAIASIVGSLAGDAIANGAAAGTAGSGQRIGGNVLAGAATGAGIGGAVGSIVPGVGTAIGAGVGGVVGGAVGLFGSAEEDKNSFFAGLGASWDEFWGETFPTFWTSLTSGFGAWLAGLGPAWDTFWAETFPKFWTDFAAGIGAWFAGIGPAWDTFWAETWPFWIGAAIGAAIGWFANLRTAWDTFWTETWPSWIADAVQSITSWFQDLKTQWDTFWAETFPQWISSAILAVSSWFQDLKTQWDTFWAETFPRWALSAKNAVVAWVAGLGPAWNNFWSRTFPEWTRSAGKAVVNWFADIRREWDNFWNRTLPAFGEKLRSYGSKLIEGLTKGFEDWWNRVKESFTKGLSFGLGTQKHNGGVIRRAGGGGVPGAGNSDTVPAMLTPGEFVVRKSIVSRVGLENLIKFNSGVLSYADMLRQAQERKRAPQSGTGDIQFFGAGGLVPQLPPSSGRGPDDGSGFHPGYSSSRGTYGPTFIVEKLIIENPKQETVSQSLHSVVRKLNYVYGGSES